MGQESKIIWNPYTSGYFGNPYDHLRICREQNPIHKGFHNEWMFFDYADVSHILRSPDFEVSEISTYFQEKEPYIFNTSNQCPYLAKGTRLWPMYLNGDSHKTVRSLIGKALNSLPWETIIEESTEEINASYTTKSEFNLVNYCAKYIYLVVRKLFGISDDVNLEEMMRYSNSLAISQDLFIPKQVYREINGEFLKGKRYFEDSPYKKMLETTMSDMGFTHDDIYSILAISLMAAFETSKDNLALSLYEIVRNPFLFEIIENNNSQAQNLLIEELFRFSSPLQYTVRVTKKPIRINNKDIDANSKLVLCLASANRDPNIFDRPDEIIAARKPNPHISFGGGSHFCLGATFARQEMRACLKPMTNFLKDYTIKENQPIQWSKQIFMRTAKSIILEPKV